MNLHLKKIITLLLLTAGLFAPEMRAEAPRLVVQIVVGSMTPDQLTRYADRLSEGGFKRLMREGIHFSSAAYNCQQTLTLTSLATLTTGAMPSTHGVVGNHWYDYIDNSRVGLIDDPSVEGLEYHTGGGQFSPVNLIAPTIGETLATYSPDSRIVTIALEADAAVVMGGKAGMSFWMNPELCHWRSSSYYLPILPEWVKQYNRSKSPLSYLLQPWSTLHTSPDYENRRRGDILVRMPQKTKGNPRPYTGTPIRDIPCEVVYRTEYDRLSYTPAGNSAVLDFAKQILTQFTLGSDEVPDLLNIYLSTPKHICEAYGPESIEAEDMFYRLDRDLEDFLTYLFAQVSEEQVVIVLTSDHGISTSYDLSPREHERFNVPQFEMIVESFLDARYGKAEEDWLLEYENKMIYLNHNLIYEKRLSLSEVQNEVATFAMQFRGVSHALSSTAMRNSYFGSGYAQLMQNSFYPRRSGDVILNLMPQWIEKQENRRATSGSMYGYDREVPLLIRLPKGAESQAGRECDQPVEMGSVAPTLAQILDIPAPAACEADPLELEPDSTPY